jgi:8-oxo-dGTP diphosphatase
MELLQATPNRFDGIVIDTETLPESADGFRARLEHSLIVWKEEDYQVVWVEIPSTKSNLIHDAIESGFSFHHSSDQYLMLTCQLVEDAFIPEHATHYIGAGGVVMNEKKELLVVCERFRGADRPPYYKLPGGALHPKEHLADGVIREVFEETGVPTHFEGLICFRHWHGYRYGKSDIYFVCRLKPLKQVIEMQVSEIEECFWMPVSEYMQSEHVSVFNKQIVNAAIDHTGLEQTFVEGYGDPDQYEFFMPDPSS